LTPRKGFSGLGKRGEARENASTQMQESDLGRTRWRSGWLLAWWLCCLIGCQVVQAEPLVLDRVGTVSPKGAQVQVLEDVEGTWTLAQVQAMSNTGAWHASEGGSLGRGYSRSAFWLRVSLVNRHPTQEAWQFGLLYPLLDEVDLYVVDAQGQVRQHHATGDRRRFDARPIRHPNFYVDLPLRAGEAGTVYVRLRSEGSLVAPLVVTTPTARLELASREMAWMGLYGGALLAMLLYNLMLFVSLRDRTHLYYVGYLGVFGLAQLTLNGMAFQYLWPHHPEWGNWALPVCMSAAGVLLSLFVRDFLALKTHAPRADRLMQGLQGLFLLILPVLWLGHYAPAVKLATALTTVAPVVLLGITTAMLRRGHQQARYFLAAFGGLLIGLIAASLSMFDLVKSSWLTTYGLQIGSTLEFVLLSLALAHRFKLAQDEHVRLQEAHAAELEARVLARTQDLDKALGELTEANARLQELSQRDALTTLYNRQFLAERMPEIWGTAVRWKQSLGLLMIDIDHFKQVNDVHGHAAGDEALKAVADVILRIMRRPGDHAIRYGGEEFLVVLPQTHAAGAAHIAERIREEVEALTVTYGGQVIPLTVSIGVACTTPGPRTSMALMLQLADRLLYQAKAEGRNRCVLLPSTLSHIRPSESESPEQT
jgi:two-component system, sensor histidine kinase LadS